MSDTIDVFCKSVKSGKFTEVPEFARGFCGPGCHFVRAIEELLGPPAAEPRLRADMLSALDELDNWIGRGQDAKGAGLDALSERIRGKLLKGDTTLPPRWLAISQLTRSQLAGHGEEDGLLQEAKKHFEQGWALATDNFKKRDWEQVVPGESSAPTGPEKGLAARYPSLLKSWTPGSWMAWDMLCQMNKTCPPLAFEKANVLFGGGEDGQVMKLVVELLPGPARFVVPNWWRLGMAALPTTGADTYFLGAVQRALTLAAPNRGIRLRWHLEALDESAWEWSLEGRSVEAAAACVTLAAFELLDEIEDGRAQKPQPVLDNYAAVTALVAGADPRDFLASPLGRLSGGEKDAFPAKFAAALRHRIDVIGVCAGQHLKGLTTPAAAEVETVGEALELLRTVSRAFARYAKHVRASFRYQEEKTPAGK